MRMCVPSLVVVRPPSGGGAIGVVEKHVEGIRAKEFPEHLLGVPEGEAEERRRKALLEEPTRAIEVCMVMRSTTHAAQAAIEALLAIPVVHLALFVVRENFIGFRDLLEPPLSLFFFFWVFVRMPFKG